MRFAPIILSFWVLAVAGCASSNEAPRESRRGSYARPPIVVRPLFPADYMATASSIDLFVMRSSELALARAQSPRLRQFAMTMIADHRGTSAQLSFGGRRLNLLPSATMLPAHQAMFDELSASGNFDASYRRQQIAVHQAAAKLHSDFAARGESPTLRTVARNAAPIERRHLDSSRRL
jgi:predicted outer membrane protein